MNFKTKIKSQNQKTTEVETAFKPNPYQISNEHLPLKIVLTSKKIKRLVKQQKINQKNSTEFSGTRKPKANWDISEKRKRKYLENLR